MTEVVAEQLLDLLGSDQKVSVRLFRPEQRDAETWTCRFEIGAPISRALNVSGESSLQALALAVFGLSASLYSTDLFRDGQLGAFGAFDGFLGIPAPSSYKDIARHTF
jgi:hypothetical protein